MLRENLWQGHGTTCNVLKSPTLNARLSSNFSACTPPSATSSLWTKSRGRRHVPSCRLATIPNPPRRSVLLSLSGLLHLQVIQEVDGSARNCPFMAG